jgi:hypothetical protein
VEAVFGGTPERVATAAFYIFDGGCGFEEGI